MSPATLAAITDQVSPFGTVIVHGDMMPSLPEMVTAWVRQMMSPVSPTAISGKVLSTTV